MLAVAAGLLSLAPTADSFLSAPMRGAGGPGAAEGLRRSKGEARLAQAGRQGGRALSATGVATEDNQGAEGSLLETQQKGVSNNEMRPFVRVPRRDPRVWFDAIREGAVPRPDSLIELSK